MSNYNGQSSSSNSSVEFNFVNVLIYLEKEYRKFNESKLEWNLERAELKNEIVQLKEAKVRNERIQFQLLKRIKMLEFALRSDRVKYKSLLDSQAEMEDEDKMKIGPSLKPVSVPHFLQNKLSSEAIRTYLKELQCTDLWPLISKSSNEFLADETNLLTTPLSPSSSLAVKNQNNIGNPNMEQTSSLTQQQQQQQQQYQQQQLDPVNSSVIVNKSNEIALMSIEDQLKQYQQKEVVESIVPTNTTDTSTIEASVDLPMVVGLGTTTTTTTTAAAAAKTEHHPQESERTSLSGENVEGGEDGEDTNNKEEAAMYKKLSESISKRDLQRLMEKAKREEKNSLSKQFVSEFKSSGSNKKSSNLNRKSALSSSAMGGGGGSFTPEQLGDLQKIQSDPNTVIDNKTSSDLLNSNSSSSKLWKPKYSLLSHFSGVRALQFLPAQLYPQQSNVFAFLSASEDWTVKLWNLKKIGKKSIEQQPIHTYMGHEGPVFTVATDGRYVYSAGMDRDIRIWDMAPLDKSPLTLHGIAVPYEKAILSQAHSGPIWSIALDNNNNNSSTGSGGGSNSIASSVGGGTSASAFTSPHTQLLSAAADSTIKLWDVSGGGGLKESPLLGTYLPDTAASCVKFLETDVSKFLCSTVDGQMILFDLESRKPVWISNNSIAQKDSNNNINGMNAYSFVAHPTLNIALSGHEDQRIRMWDLSGGKMVHQWIGHQDAVSCISLDPGGLSFASGSHDGSIRVWDLAGKNYACLQDLTAVHRSKLDEAVLSLAYHPDANAFLVSGGADSVIKVFS